MQKRGFTLLEVILSIAIISILSVFLLRIVTGSIHISDHVSERKESNLETASQLESAILQGIEQGADRYTISLPGSAAVEMTKIESIDDTGTVFRIYIQKE